LKPRQKSKKLNFLKMFIKLNNNCLYLPYNSLDSFENLQHSRSNFFGSMAILQTLGVKSGLPLATLAMADKTWLWLEKGSCG
jgi:hypothetical protein